MRFATNTTEIIDDIRSAIGRIVTFYKEIKEDCPACEIDPITGNSTNSFCTTCSGLGYIPTLSGTQINAHILHGAELINQWPSAGPLFDGDARIQVKYTEANFTVVKEADYVEVDTIPFLVKEPRLRGTPEINRIIVDLKQRE